MSFCRKREVQTSAHAFCGRRHLQHGMLPLSNLGARRNTRRFTEKRKSLQHARWRASQERRLLIIYHDAEFDVDAIWASSFIIFSFNLVIRSACSECCGGCPIMELPKIVP